MESADGQQYSCFSSSHSTLSRIDMVLGNGEALQLEKNIMYLPRGVSDHSPLVLSVNLGGKYPGGFKNKPILDGINGESR